MKWRVQRKSWLEVLLADCCQFLIKKGHFLPCTKFYQMAKNFFRAINPFCPARHQNRRAATEVWTKLHTAINISIYFLHFLEIEFRNTNSTHTTNLAQFSINAGLSVLVWLKLGQKIAPPPTSICCSSPRCRARNEGSCKKKMD